MKKFITFSLTLIISFFIVNPAYAQTATGGAGQIENFIRSIIQLLVTLAGITATGFFVWGGFRYITSSGSPEQLEGAKKTILYSAVGLAIALGAFVLSNIVSGLATTAFGAAQ
ncbi:MAG TPA: pilin [Methylomirabilota bacterium]|nr:pilin [Methylomirabilota bacterium]